MPRKLDITEEERMERRKQQRRVNALKYYHANNPSKNPRTPIDEVDNVELRSYLQKKHDYHRQYYEKNRDKLLQRSNEWNKTRRGLAITTVEL